MKSLHKAQIKDIGLLLSGIYSDRLIRHHIKYQDFGGAYRAVLLKALRHKEIVDTYESNK